MLHIDFNFILKQTKTVDFAKYLGVNILSENRLEKNGGHYGAADKEELTRRSSSAPGGSELY